MKIYLSHIEENCVFSPGTGWCVRFCVEKSLDFSATLVKLVADVENVVDEVLI